MSQIVNRLKKNFYLDSVALMRLSVRLCQHPDVDNAAMMVATPSNVEILRQAGLRGDDDDDKAGPEDLLIAFTITDSAKIDEVDAFAQSLLSEPSNTARGDAVREQSSFAAANEHDPDATLAMISVPGAYARREAMRAIDAGLDVMIFSDNVSVEDELALKTKANAVGRLVMGPDCGTAIIQGTPLAFANHVPIGDVGIIAASGTGAQEASCLLAHCGRGVSQIIGTGGRDLDDRIGGITALAAIELLADDPRTREIVVISKPPGATTRKKILERLAACPKPTSACFIGADTSGDFDGVRMYRTLRDTAAALCGTRQETCADAAGDAIRQFAEKLTNNVSRRTIRGLFAGGTLCAEAQLVLADAGLSVGSNVPIPGAEGYVEGDTIRGHLLLDLGADEFTLGLPHPMIEPMVRTPHLERAIRDESVAVVLVDIVLGTGSHKDPAAAVIACLGEPTNAAVVASVCGTEQDPQQRSRQVELLRDAGVLVAASNAAAAEIAVAITNTVAA